jgi:hypothetical protein
VISAHSWSWLSCGFDAALQRRSVLKKFFNAEMEEFFKNDKRYEKQCVIGSFSEMENIFEKIAEWGICGSVKATQEESDHV